MMTLRQKAYQAIKNRIIYFELKPGEKILESQLARDLKIGRLPIREALVMLENERLIRKTEGYGFTVTKLNDSEIGDYFTIRAALEEIGVRLLMERITQAEIAKMKKHVDRAVPIYEKGCPRHIIESDTKFHELIYQGTKSEVFYRTMATLSDKTIIMRAAALHTSKGRDASLNDHIAMMEAIEKRDQDALCRLTHEHIQFAPKYYESVRHFIAF